MRVVLFVCLENKARSQIAKAFFNKMAAEEKIPWRAASAGTVAEGEVYPETKRVI